MNTNADVPGVRVSVAIDRGPGCGWRQTSLLVLRALEIVVLGVFPILLTAFRLKALLAGHQLAVDFGQGPWPAGRSLLAGRTPYVTPNSPALQGITFVYPAMAALLLSPFSLLTHPSADITFSLLNLAAVLLTLRVLGIRDWRLYGVSLLWPSVQSGWATGNITLLLTLGVALLWRHRDRPGVAGCLIAVLISVKAFLWPLGLWLIATRRTKALVYAVAFALALNLGAWGVVGFGQIGRYAADLTTLTRYQGTRGYSLIALFIHAGADRQLAYGLMVASAVFLSLACVAAGGRSGGRAAFAISVLACLAATPIEWLHYFAVLIVPLSIARPRLSLLWVIPLLFPFPTVGPSTAEILLTFVIAAMVTGVAAMAPEPQQGRPRDLARLVLATL